MGKTIGVDLGDMDNFFANILLIDKNFVENIQALGRDRQFFSEDD
jgi:hypothetical protein